ncbi:MAG: hypothetical protein ACP5D1_13445, partial [Bacteroidales bacterium]
PLHHTITPSPDLASEGFIEKQGGKKGSMACVAGNFETNSDSGKKIVLPPKNLYFWPFLATGSRDDES